MKTLRVGCTLALVALTCAAAPAGAHAAYRASDPADEETVAQAPSSVWAEFTEPVTLDSRLEVYDPCGERVDGGDSSVTGYRITVSMASERAGTYTVAFSVISAVDGHPTQGSFTFRAAQGEPCPGAEPPGGAGKAEPRPRGGASAGGAAAPAALASPAPARPQSRRAGRSAPSRPARSPAATPDVPAAVQPAAQPATSPVPAQDDPPLGGVLAGLAVAAAIGAVGGFVYVRLLRPPP